MQIQCAVCQTNFSINPSRYQQNQNKIFGCSKKCGAILASKRLSKKIEKPCIICNKPCFYKVSHFKKKKHKDKCTCSYACSAKLRETLYLSHSNPNNRYFLDPDMFKNVDTEQKAYLLGWIASDGSIRPGSITIAIHKKDINILNEIVSSLNLKIPVVVFKQKPMCKITINSKEISKDICNLLQIQPRKKSDIVQMPSLSSENITWAFIRGYFDGDGHVRNYYKSKSLETTIASNSFKMLESIGKFTKLRYRIHRNQIVFSWFQSLKFLSKMYDTATIKLERKYSMYQLWKNHYNDNQVLLRDRCLPPTIVESNLLEGTVDGAGGFGSTGTK
jgi:hypothetical protein